MPNWKELLEEINNVQKAGEGQASHRFDLVRRKYLKRLHAKTGRNIIVYYSGWLQKKELINQGISGFELDDDDKNGFMATIHKLKREKGLDLLLHTPGGDMAATESLVDYLRAMFGTDIRAVIPQIAMSGGTIVALACKQIVMGKHSSLGPIDPQRGGVPAHGVIEEFKKAGEEIAQNPALIPLWQQIIANYPPTFIGECQKAILWAKDMVKEWLITGMFKGDTDASAKADLVIEGLTDSALNKSHSRHIPITRAQALGIHIVPLEEDQELQDAVLTVHHACIQTLTSTGAIKLIENHDGVAHIRILQQQK